MRLQRVLGCKGANGMRQQWSLEGWILSWALDQAFFNSLSTTQLSNHLPGQPLLYTHKCKCRWSREKKKNLLFPLLQSFLPLNHMCFFFSPVLCLTHSCPPNPVVAGELQENIWGQRQQPTTQYSCTGRNEHLSICLMAESAISNSCWSIRQYWSAIFSRRKVFKDCKWFMNGWILHPVWSLRFVSKLKWNAVCPCLLECTHLLWKSGGKKVFCSFFRIVRYQISSI